MSYGEQAARAAVACSAPFGPVARSASAALANELRAVRTRVEALSLVMVSDPRFVRDHGEAMQSFDFIVQHVDECAILLDGIAQGDDLGQALANIRLTEMQHRLQSHLESAGGDHGQLRQ